MTTAARTALAYAAEATPLEAGLKKIAEGLQKVSEGFYQLSLVQLQPTQIARPLEELLTIDEAAEALGKVSRRTVHRFADRYPEVRRKVGSLVKYERGALLRAVRKG